jgi:hypothetical protein
MVGIDLANIKRNKEKKSVKEDAMQAAEKIAECACGITTEIICAGCGEPLCNHCGTAEISSFDPKNVEVEYYCEKCKQDPAKNVWGTLYWENLVSKY